MKCNNQVQRDLFKNRYLNTQNYITIRPQNGSLRKPTPSSYSFTPLKCLLTLPPPQLPLHPHHPSIKEVVRRKNAVREDVDLRDDYEECEDKGEGVWGLGGCVVGCG